MSIHWKRFSPTGEIKSNASFPQQLPTHISIFLNNRRLKKHTIRVNMSKKKRYFSSDKIYAKVKSVSSNQIIIII